MDTKVDYSELVTALQDNNAGRASQLMQELRPRLETYLKVRMSATTADAQEVVQVALIETYKKIIAGDITREKYILKYLMTACRYNYVRYIEEENQYRYGGGSAVVETFQTPARQVENLMDHDRQKILAECLDALPKKKRKYITYIMEHPHISTKGLSDKFGISKSNVRVKKSRIIEALGKCVEKKEREDEWSR